MLIVDIYIPALDGKYDFMLDENRRVDVLTDSIVKLLETKLNEGAYAGERRFLLCSFRQRRILPEKLTLKECGIKSGCRLLLV